jgi:hypothetical protein
MPRLPVLLAPILLAVGIVVGQLPFAVGSFLVALRPMLVAVAAAVVCTGIAVLVLRDRPLASLAATAAVAALGGLGVVVAVVLAAAIPLAYWWRVRRHRSVPIDRLARVVSAATAVFVLIGLAAFAATGPLWPGAAVTGPRTATRPGRPIYVIVLDAYARHDTLAEEFGHDNGPFLAELERRGFDVYRDAHSNYSSTSLTLASMLNARPIQELDIDGFTASAQYRALNGAMNSGRAWEALRDRGYRLAVVPSMWSGSRIWQAEHLVDMDGLTDFERHLLQSTALGGMVELVAPDWIAGQHRAHTLRQFSALRQAVDDRTFVLAHLMLPHSPFLFDADGSARPMPDCFPSCPFWTPWRGGFPDGQAPAYLAQLEYTNAQMLALADSLPPEAVVVLMADHGSRYTSDARERVRVFLAARTPGHPRLFGDAPTPLRWFPRLLNTYADTDLPEHDVGHWISGDQPLRLSEIDPTGEPAS